MRATARIRLALLYIWAVALALPAGETAAPTPAPPPLLAHPAVDEALSAVGHTRASAGLDRNELRRRPPCRFVRSIFHAWVDEPLRIPDRQRHLRQALAMARDNAEALLGIGAALVDAESRRSLIPPTPGERFTKALEEHSLPVLLARLAAAVRADPWCTASDATQAAPAGEAADALAERLKDVPLPVQQAACLIVAACTDFLVWRSTALRNCRSADLRSVAAELFGAPAPETAPPGYALPADLVRAAREADLLEHIDFPRLYAGCLDLAAAVDRALTLLQTQEEQEPFQVEIDTALGRIALSAGQDDT